MITVLVAQQLLAQSFLGGSGQDLARFYLLSAKRSVVCSDRVFKTFGPNRFFLNSEDNLIYPDGSLFSILHNAPIQKIEIPSSGQIRTRQFPNVDSIISTILPLTVAGIVTVDSETQLKEKTTNPSNFSLTPSGPTKALIGKGSDSISDLVNVGLSKPLIYPALLGNIWFSCSMVQASEIDFLNAVAQIADCKLVDKKDEYEFVPDLERLRLRLLNSYHAYGDTSDTYEGFHQKALTRAYEIAAPEILAETISNTKMSKIMPMPDDRVLKSLCLNLKSAAVKTYSKSDNPLVRALAEGVSEEGRMSLGYSYGFGFFVAVPLKNGRLWFI